MNYKTYLYIALCFASTSVIAMDDSQKTAENPPAALVKAPTFLDLFLLAQELQLKPKNARPLLASVRDYPETVKETNGSNQTLLHALLTPQFIIERKNCDQRAQWHQTTTIRCLAAILDVGVSIKQADCFGDTPLHCAAKQCAPLPILAYLIEQDPSSVIKINKSGYTAQDLFFNNISLLPMPEPEDSLAYKLSILRKSLIELHAMLDIEELLSPDQRSKNKSGSSDHADRSSSSASDTLSTHRKKLSTEEQ